MTKKNLKRKQRFPLNQTVGIQHFIMIGFWQDWRMVVLQCQIRPITKQYSVKNYQIILLTTSECFRTETLLLQLKKVSFLLKQKGSPSRFSSNHSSKAKGFISKMKLKPRKDTLYLQIGQIISCAQLTELLGSVQTCRMSTDISVQ